MRHLLVLRDVWRLDSNKFSCAAGTGYHSFHGNTTMGLQLVQQVHNLFSSACGDVTVHVCHSLLLQSSLSETVANGRATIGL